MSPVYGDTEDPIENRQKERREETAKDIRESYESARAGLLVAWLALLVVALSPWVCDPFAGTNPVVLGILVLAAGGLAVASLMELTRTRGKEIEFLKEEQECE